MAAAFDYVIVGAGSAGCVLANRLSTNPSVSVCLIEAGPDDSVSANIAKADRWFSTLAESHWHWPLASAPQPALSGRSLELHQARVAGGCGSHNASFFVRGSPFDYDRWAHEFGCTGWDYESMLPFFKSIETSEVGDESARGRSGELHVRQPSDLTPVAKIFVEACGTTLGLPAGRDYNDGRTQTCAAPVQFNARGNARQSAWAAFIRPLLGVRKNLTVRLSEEVDRVVFDEHRRATGVQLASGAVVRASHDVILSAGVYHTPKLLMLSGIGDRRHLAEFGISVIADVPGVGCNLSDHLWTLIRQMVVPPDAPYSPNPHTEDWIQVQAFGCLDGSLNARRPDFQILGTCRDTNLAGFPLPPELLATQDRLWGLAVAHLTPASRGSVKLRSSNPRDAPLIDPCYLSAEEDRRAWRMIAERCAKLGRAMSDRIPGSIQAIPAPGSDDYAHVLGSVVTMWHGVGTAKMGPASDPFAVVDPATLRVRGVQGLRVADASLFPVVTAGNTNAPTMAVAARAAHVIAGSNAARKAPTSGDGSP